jgi:hypothetical protein
MTPAERKRREMEDCDWDTDYSHVVAEPDYDAIDALDEGPESDQTERDEYDQDREAELEAMRADDERFEADREADYEYELACRGGEAA